MKSFNSSTKNVGLPIVFAAVLVCIAQPASAEDSGAGSQGVKKSPTFQEADKNGDHHVTKDELKSHPDLLKYFDKFDAGEDGRLDDHEYENVIREKGREKGM
ncbi:MAG: hypothetical protein ACXWT3_02645 [Methylococcaceae bacterium]